MLVAGGGRLLMHDNACSCIAHFHIVCSSHFKYRFLSKSFLLNVDTTFNWKFYTELSLKTHFGCLCKKK